MIYVEITEHNKNTGIYKVTIDGEDYYTPVEIVIQAFGGRASREYSVYIVKSFHELREVLMRKVLGI